MRSALMAFAIGLVLSLHSAADAEFVQIEPVAAELADKVAPLIGERDAVVASRVTERARSPWAIHEALAVQVTAALCTRGIDAIRAATHPATESLSAGYSPFTSAEARRVSAADHELLVAVELSTTGGPRSRS